MKHLAILSLFALHSSFFIPSASAGIPLKWSVETSRAVPAQFEAYQGETLAFEAALQSYGKPLEAPLNYSLYWQTNGMGRYYWEVPCTTGAKGVPPVGTGTNVLFATWSPTNDVGAKVYNCFIGQPGTIYHAAFQLRLRPSPGAVPNELPLPQKVIDFAKVTVLNPPWSGGGGGGVDTNAVRDIIHATVDGAARPLPRYLHECSFDDSYPDAAAEYYRSRGDGKTDGGCSAVRDGGFLYRNFDYPFDDRAEFVVKMSAGAGRFASVGVAQVGTNLTEQIVTSGKPSRWYKALPGATIDGINEHGVVAEINVVDGNPQTSGWHTDATSDAINPLGAIRWILDHATNAQHAAEYIAANIRFPQGWTQNFHFMVADATSTYIVENGAFHSVGGDVPGAPPAVLTNFRLYPARDTTGEGQERYDALASGANITSQWWTLTYTHDGYRASDIQGLDTNLLFRAWAAKSKEQHRGERFGTKTWWQSIHSSIYDLTNRTLRIAVQENPDWYTFAVPPGATGISPVAVRKIVDPLVAAATNGLPEQISSLSSSVSGLESSKRGKTDLDVYERKWTFSGDVLPGAVYSLGEEVRDTEVEYSLDENGSHFAYFYTDTPEPIDRVEFHYDSGPDRVIVAVRGLDSTGSKLTYTSATSGLAKLGAGGELTAATPSSTGGASADYRDPKDATCYEDVISDWQVTVEPGAVFVYLSYDYGEWTMEISIDGIPVVLHSNEPESATHLDFGYGNTATRTAVCTSNETFVTTSYVTNEVAAATKAIPYSAITNPPTIPVISETDPTFSNAVLEVVRSIMPTTLRAYDSVRHCWWNIQPVNGVLTLTVED